MLGTPASYFTFLKLNFLISRVLIVIPTLKRCCENE